MRKLLILMHATIIFLVAAGLRAWSMRSEAPGFAEMVATLCAMRRPADYLASAHTDFCPPLYYLILHPLTSVSLSVSLLRLASVLAGSFTCVAIYFAARYLFGAAAGLLCGYLLAVHPLHIYYSQEAQPFALTCLLLVPALLLLVRTVEENRWRDWLLYDLALIAILYTQREALLLIGAFPLVQLLKTAFYPPVEEQRRIRRIALIQAILLNHLLIGAVALPWMSVMPKKLVWSLPRPTATDLLRVFSHYDIRGMSAFYLPGAKVVTIGMYLLLVPPLLRVLRQHKFRHVAVVAMLAVGLIIPFGFSVLRSARFTAGEQAMLTLPFYITLIGMLMAYCNTLVRLVLFVVFCGIFLSATVRQAITVQKTSWTAMRNEILKAQPTEHDIAAFWPDFTTEIGKYWNVLYGRRFQSTSAMELLDQYASLPSDSRVFFVISQFPSKQPHLYTFRGALTQYAATRLLYKERLNMVLQASNIDQKNLRLWYKDPESLKLLDQPSSQTQFLFTAADPVFKNSQFEWERPDLTYDSKGRRCVWTRTRHVDLNLTVTLAPGYYVVRLHCSPNFEQPEYDREIQRVVNVEMLSGADRRKSVVKEETTMKLSTSTDTELKRLHLSIDTEPMVKVPAPGAGEYGLRIYSIAIDQAEATEPGKS